MKPKNLFLVTGLLIGAGGILVAQSSLNNTPSRAIGQPQLIPSTSNPNLIEGRELYLPQSVAIDSSASPPVLYVSDFFNNRVLAWKNAAVFSNGAPADFVIGQKDMLSTTRGGPGTILSSGLYRPTGLAVDKSGNLYIVDVGNNRILRFPTPYAQSGQPLPDLVIGQTSFSCTICNQPNAGGISAKTISVANPNIFVAGLVFDAQGNLWFTDAANHRVLRYPAAALGPNASNGPAADLVLGQFDFTTSTPPPVSADSQQSRTVLYYPAGLAFDPAGRLYVADSLNRVLVYPGGLQPPIDFGKAAIRMMGLIIPARGTPAPPPINEVQFFNPQGIFMVGSSPGIVDTGNNRLLLFDPIEQWPADGSSPHAKSTSGPMGQFGYAANKANRAQAEPSGATFSQPTAAVVNGNELFVADSGNNRILVFPVSGLGQNSSATRVLGQDDFAFRSPNLIEGREFSFVPGTGGGDGGLLVDLASSVPHLYVADTSNNRVLGFRDARTVRPGDKADLVIGQPDFQRSVVNYPSNDPAKPTNQSLYAPTGLVVDPDGNLYVADTGNGRVLRFPKPFDQSQGNLPTANLVLGQSNFGAQVTDPTQRTMRAPYGLAFTSDTSLLVSDAGLNRVLLFPGRASNFTNGMSATKAFGQPDFNSFATGSEGNQMNTPRHIATDSDDRLYVADEVNNRVLIFDQVSVAGTNARAGTILTGPNTGNAFGGPRGIFVSKLTGEIWLTEANVGRLLRFPKFDDLLGQQNQSNLQIISAAGVAIGQDSFGDLFVAEATNRIAIYFPGLSAVNSANSLQGRALAPGAITAVYRQGTNFSDTAVVTDQSTWPTVLANTQVLVNNAPAPLYFVSPNQLTFLMPMNAPSSGTVEVQVVRQSTGQILAVSQIDMAPASPGLFTTSSSGSGPLAAFNEDGSLNQASNPIGRGHVISIFGTGQGFIAGAPPDGQPPSGAVNTDIKPDVWIEPAFVDPANVLYSGLAPGLVGVWQINFKVPDLTAPGNTVQVFVRLKSVASSQAPQRTTIAVKQ